MSSVFRNPDIEHGFGFEVSDADTQLFFAGASVLLIIAVVVLLYVLVRRSKNPRARDGCAARNRKKYHGRVAEKTATGGLIRARLINTSNDLVAQRRDERILA